MKKQAKNRKASQAKAAMSVTVRVTFLRKVGTAAVKTYFSKATSTTFRIHCVVRLLKVGIKG